ncbi:hypothetical protein HK101_009394 [Irineochytrium annulatum]|nr:hypothetical protein HK101_009394 [Irineochytrium annulatum]
MSNRDREGSPRTASRRISGGFNLGSVFGGGDKDRDRSSSLSSSSAANANGNGSVGVLSASVNGNGGHAVDGVPKSPRTRSGSVAETIRSMLVKTPVDEFGPGSPGSPLRPRSTSGGGGGYFGFMPGGGHGAGLPGGGHATGNGAAPNAPAAVGDGAGSSSSVPGSKGDTPGNVTNTSLLKKEEEPKAAPVPTKSAPAPPVVVTTTTSALSPAGNNISSAASTHSGKAGHGADRSFKNSSRIVHAYGVGGIAPLAPLNQKKGEPPKKEEKSSNIPVMVSWTGGGRTVYITGSFNNWKQKIRLTKSKSDFSTVIDMPASQTHRFKFIVDDEWKCSEDLPMAQDPDGNLVNYLEVMDERGEKIGDGLDSLSRDMQETSLEVDIPESPTATYTSKIPGYLNWHLQPPPTFSASLANLPKPEPPPLPNDYPPLLPPHMEKVLLNTAATAAASQANTGARDDNNELPMPSSVTLNHLWRYGFGMYDTISE